MTANVPGLEPRIEDVAAASSEVEERDVRRRHTSRRRLYLRRFLRNRATVVGLAILALLILFALVGPLFTGYTHTDVDFANLSSPPSPEHVFGTNGAGNDTYAQAVHGLQRSLVIARGQVRTDQLRGRTVLHPDPRDDRLAAVVSRQLKPPGVSTSCLIISSGEPAGACGHRMRRQLAPVSPRHGRVTGWLERSPP